MMKDDFWDIDKLLPYRPSRRASAYGKSVGEIREITDGEKHDASIPISELSVFEGTPENEYEYKFSSESLILERVTVSDRPDSYSYSNDFFALAHKTHGEAPKTNAEYTPFFSYMPQYTDLTPTQYAFYLSWRERVRNGAYVKTDASYIFLYIYEIFALDDVLDHSASMDLLISLWNAYRDEHISLDKYMCDWIVDYALIHNLPIPLKRLGTILPNIYTKQHSLLFNMYIFDYLFLEENGITKENIEFACNVLANYSPFKSRFYDDPTYKNTFDVCIVDFFRKMYASGYFAPDNFRSFQQEVKMSRPSYISAVCSQKTKKNITAIYRPYISSELLRIAFSNIFKHIENKLRIHLGYKSRLSGIVLNDGLRELADEFMKANYPPPTKPHKNAPTAPVPVAKPIKKVEINFEKAKSIEDASWKTTEKLTEGLDIQFEADEKITPPAPQVTDTGDKSGTSASPSALLTPLEKETLRMLIAGASRREIEAFILESDSLPDAVIDSINEKALEILGDTVIDTSDYTLIEDYIDELSSF